jgi:hypothetical protein
MALKQPITSVTIVAGLLFAALPQPSRPQNVGSPFHEDYVEVNGVRLHYASVGQGPLVLFLHGYRNRLRRPSVRLEYRLPSWFGP